MSSIIHQATFKTKEAYLKKIGYKEEDGKIESRARFLERVESYMTLYAAILQVNILSSARNGIYY